MRKPRLIYYNDSRHYMMYWYDGWRLWQRADTLAGKSRWLEKDPTAGRRMVEMPWPKPQIAYLYGGGGHAG